MESTGWLALETRESMPGPGSSWDVSGTPMVSTIPESGASDALVLTGAAGIYVPPGSTGIYVEFEVSRGQQTGSNRVVTDAGVYAVIDGLGVGSNKSALSIWHAVALLTYSGDFGVVWDPADFNENFGISIAGLAEANDPARTTQARIYFASVRVSYMPPVALVAREQIMYS